MKLFAIGVGALALAAGAASAQVWFEAGPDATQFPPGQVTVGAGPLTDIVGTLAGFADVDAYCIDILTPSFAAWTETGYAPGVLGPAFAAFDSQLWLFDMNGVAIMHSDDTTLSTGSGMGIAQPNPVIGPVPPVILPGRYILAISQFDIDALDATGAEIWADLPFTGYSGPDGPGAPFFGGWDGGGFPGGPGGGDYHIVLAGATFCEIPAPGAAAVLGLGGLLAARRRR
jgi:hypothetical protein